MRRFIHSIEIALKAEDWYGALSTALTMPDICGQIEAPNRGSKERYVDWFNRYLLSHYTKEIRPQREKHIFLHGEDCYALRCSYLHEGVGAIVDQRSRQALDSFHFITPPPNGCVIHMNQSDNVLQLQVDIFCSDMCVAVDRWVNVAVKGNAELERRLGNLIEIHDSQRGIVF